MTTQGHPSTTAGLEGFEQRLVVEGRFEGHYEAKAATELLPASWQTLKAATERPEQLGSATGRAMGYPEWLALTI